jgi:hypothetical protein
VLKSDLTGPGVTVLDAPEGVRQPHRTMSDTARRHHRRRWLLGPARALRAPFAATCSRPSLVWDGADHRRGTRRHRSRCCRARRPVRCLAWLVNRLAAFGGGLHAGDEVLTVSLHAACPVDAPVTFGPSSPASIRWSLVSRTSTVEGGAHQSARGPRFFTCRSQVPTTRS